MKKLVSLSIVFLSLLAICIFNNSSNILSKVEATMHTQVRALHILVQTEDEANQIKSEIMQGKDRSEIFLNFRSAAKKYSKCPSGTAGGDLGWFSKGDMVLPFEQAAFDLSPGNVSNPVKTQFGWHLIYVVGRK